MTYSLRVTAWAYGPSGEPLYSEMQTVIEIVTEAAGEFVEVSQHGHTDLGKIQINPDEWPGLRDAIEHAVALCRGEN
jgi:hypothetical protein